MELSEIDSICRCQCTHIAFTLKSRNDKWINISEKSFLKSFNLKRIPENHLPVYKCSRCIGIWRKDKGTTGVRANRVEL